MVLALRLWGASNLTGNPGGMLGSKQGCNISGELWVSNFKITLVEEILGTALDQSKPSQGRRCTVLDQAMSFGEVAALCHGLEEDVLPKKIIFVCVKCVKSTQHKVLPLVDV